MRGWTLQEFKDFAVYFLVRAFEAYKEKKHKKMVFGNVKAGVFVVVIQKRGLPNYNYLIILEDKYNLKTSECLFQVQRFNFL